VINKLQITNYKLQITNYKLQITNYKLQITNYKLQITNYKLQSVLMSKQNVYFQVICKSCNHCRDIDLCKDPNVSNPDEMSNVMPVWICASADCRTPYDTAEIEHQLIDAIHRRTMGYILQDLQCLKCKGVKMANLATHCSCAGKFKPLHDPKNLGKLLRTFKSIANHYGMPLLKEIVGWIDVKTNVNTNVICKKK
jgi:hypothetical protein